MDKIVEMFLKYNADVNIKHGFSSKRIFGVLFTVAEARRTIQGIYEAGIRIDQILEKSLFLFCWRTFNGIRL
jgi:hypothetical protein